MTHHIQFFMWHAYVNNDDILPLGETDLDSYYFTTTNLSPMYIDFKLKASWQLSVFVHRESQFFKYILGRKGKGVVSFFKNMFRRVHTLCPFAKNSSIEILFFTYIRDTPTLIIWHCFVLDSEYTVKKINLTATGKNNIVS